ncbi:MAG: hypothetical protein Roseis2KO_50440 [Roseivirga sp.]
MGSIKARQKTLEYFIEFILVIVGISIAFWLSELAEEKKKDELEIQYLKDILEDLQADVELIDYLTLLNQSKTTELERGVRMFQQDRKKINADSVPQYTQIMGNLNLFSPNNFTYITLKQSGDFKIIKNHDIRKRLVQLYSSYESIEFEQVNLTQALDDHFYSEYFDNYDMINDRIVNREFMTSSYISNFIAFSLSQTNSVLVFFERSKTIAEQTIALIEEELE